MIEEICYQSEYSTVHVHSIPEMFHHDLVFKLSFSCPTLYYVTSVMSSLHAYVLWNIQIDNRLL